MKNFSLPEVAPSFQPDAMALQMRYRCQCPAGINGGVVSPKEKQVANGKLRSGRAAVVSGLYRIDHQNCLSEIVWIAKGQMFPVCPDCGESAAFGLEQQVDHITEDPDFA